jgi:hypothetical protein
MVLIEPLFNRPLNYYQQKLFCFPKLALGRDNFAMAAIFTDRYSQPTAALSVIE